MSIEKTSSVVLATRNYRESSMLLYLFTFEQGRLNVIAKGIRNGKNRQCVPVERGYCIEHVLYCRPHRDLQQIANCLIREYYPAIRCSLEKTALRDLLFDVVLAGVNIAEPHQELYGFLVRFLECLEDLPSEMTNLVMFLSRSLLTLVSYLGFALDLERCVGCGRTLGTVGMCRVDIPRGMILCQQCSGFNASTELVLRPELIIRLQMGEKAFLNKSDDALPPKDLLGLLGLVLDFCRYHLDIQREIHSFSFLGHLLTIPGK